MTTRSLALCLHLLFLAAGCDLLLHDKIEQYNHVDMHKDSDIFLPDDSGESEAFSDYSFTCRHQDDYLPEESPSAKAAFDRFVAEFDIESDPTPEDKRHRIDLVEQAIAAGSWRAEYFDAMWGLWTYRTFMHAKESAPYMKRLVKLAKGGNPIAWYAALDYGWSWRTEQSADFEQLMKLYKAGIELGSAPIMSRVGYNLATHSRALRPMAVKMLECAAEQGEAGAYDGLGQVAWDEGRWVDAYRTWERGTNLGCDRCIDRLIPLATPGNEDNDDIRKRLDALTAFGFSQKQSLFNISKLPSLRHLIPAELQLHLGDRYFVSQIKDILAK